MSQRVNDSIETLLNEEIKLAVAKLYLVTLPDTPMTDLFINIRGLTGVISLRVIDPSVSNNVGEKRTGVSVKFIPSEGKPIEYTLALMKEIKSIDGVKIVRLDMIDNYKVLKKDGSGWVI